MEKENLIELQNLTIAYGSKLIIENANLTIPRGSFVSVTGKSGSGKSSLLYMLGGFLRPAKGRYLFSGQPVYTLGEFGLGRFRKKNIGYLFQDFRLLPFLTIRKNILFPLYFTGRQIGDRAEQLMKLLKIDHRKNAYPSGISGGEAQRTALARALLLEPQLLLLDEPTGNLDSETEDDILVYLKELISKGFTLVCVTHSHKISQESDMVWHLEKGKIDQKLTSKKRGPTPRKKRAAVEKTTVKAKSSSKTGGKKR